MKTAVLPWRALGVVAAIAALAALRSLSSAPLGSEVREAASSQLRLSFSARPERIERCRELSDDELAKLPAHMRLRTTCEGFSARYELAVVVGERELARDTLRGGGLRHDRPLHVFREHDLIPGERRLRIDVVRLDDDGPSSDPDTASAEPRATPDTLLGGRADRERDERARRTAEAIPPRLALDTVMMIPPMRVVLVTFDNNSRRLVARLEH